MELDIVLRKISVLCAFCKEYKLCVLLWYDAGLCFKHLRKKVVCFGRIFWTFLCTSEDIRTLWSQQSSWFVCVISGFRREVDKNCALLGCYPASSGNFLRKFRDNISVPSSWVKSPDFWPINLGPIRCPETSGKNTTTCCVITQNNTFLFSDDFCL